MLKKRTVSILMLAVILAGLISLTSCDDGLVHINPRKYGMNEVLCFMHPRRLLGFTVDGEYWGEDSYSAENEQESGYVYYFGKKRGKDYAIIFSHKTGKKIHESAWVFDVPFDEMFDMINNLAGEDVYPDYHTLCWLEVFNILDDKDTMQQLIPDFSNVELDVPLALCYSVDDVYTVTKYVIVQSGGELLIFETVEPVSHSNAG